MTIFLLGLAGSWALFNLLLIRTWRRMPRFRPAPTDLPQTRLSVLIPVRNEGPNIGALLEDLTFQSYPYGLFEVIVADDGSTDDTEARVRDWAELVPYPLRLLRLAPEPTSSPKKRAITQALRAATGELILTTDGDCRVGPDWLRTIEAYYRQTDAQLVSSPVTFHDDQTAFGRMQIVEFASLIGSGAVSMALGRPSMCNGANLAYRRAAFEEVGGFSGNEHLASGDDEFLMHKIAARYPGRVHFLKSPAARVTTAPHASLGGFVQQRRRWASKWRHYRDWRVAALAVYVFAVHAAVVLGAGLCLAGVVSWQGFAALLGLKFIPEFFFLTRVLSFLGHRARIGWIPMVQLVYPFYVTFFGLLAQGKGYQWKGRRLE
jgi:cellulose synthase/poly-beta-1,6-N-acetylglucosamine synthase-like glycosyltransferase